MTPLRHRMIEDMRLRGLSKSTQDHYVSAVRQLAEHYDRSPDLITEEEVRRYFLHLIEVKRLARETVTTAVCGIKFFYEHTVKREWHVVDLVRPPKQKRFPIVLSRDEVRRVLHCVHVDAYRVCLTTIYTCGLRLREATELEVSQIDGDRGQLHIIGKGNKQRFVPLSQPTLEMLRKFWLTHRSERWLFPSRNRGPKSSRDNDGGPVHFGSVQAAIRVAAIQSGIRKPVTARSLRHSYATHLLESGVNLRLIQVYLGHSSLRTTAIYTHLTREVTDAAKAPIEALMRGL